MEPVVAVGEAQRPQPLRQPLQAVLLGEADGPVELASTDAAEIHPLAAAVSDGSVDEQASRADHRAASARVASRAAPWATAWKAEMGRPNWWRSVT